MTAGRIHTLFPMPVPPVSVGPHHVGDGRPLLWIAGPCVIESRDHCLAVAEQLRGIADRLAVPLVFKASFDKANRSSGKSFRGPGLDAGLKTLAAVKAELPSPPSRNRSLLYPLALLGVHSSAANPPR